MIRVNSQYLGVQQTAKDVGLKGSVCSCQWSKSCRNLQVLLHADHKYRKALGRDPDPATQHLVGVSITVQLNENDAELLQVLRTNLNPDLRPNQTLYIARHHYTNTFLAQRKQKKNKIPRRRGDGFSYNEFLNDGDNGTLAFVPPDVPLEEVARIVADLESRTRDLVDTSQGTAPDGQNAKRNPGEEPVLLHARGETTLEAQNVEGTSSSTASDGLNASGPSETAHDNVEGNSCAASVRLHDFNNIPFEPMEDQERSESPFSIISGDGVEGGQLDGSFKIDAVTEYEPLPLIEQCRETTQHPVSPDGSTDSKKRRMEFEPVPVQTPPSLTLNSTILDLHTQIHEQIGHYSYKSEEYTAAFRTIEDAIKGMQKNLCDLLKKTKDFDDFDNEQKAIRAKIYNKLLNDSLLSMVGSMKAWLDSLGMSPADESRSNDSNRGGGGAGGADSGSGADDSSGDEHPTDANSSGNDDCDGNKDGANGSGGHSGMQVGKLHVDGMNASDETPKQAIPTDIINHFEAEGVATCSSKAEEDIHEVLTTLASVHLSEGTDQESESGEATTRAPNNPKCAREQDPSSYEDDDDDDYSIDGKTEAKSTKKANMQTMSDSVTLATKETTISDITYGYEVLTLGTDYTVHEAFQVFRFRPLRVRNSPARLQGQPAEVQITKFQFWKDGNEVSLDGAQATASEIGKHERHPASAALSLDNKWFNKDYTHDCWWQVRLPSPVIVHEFSYITGNDWTDRDPIDWVLEASSDGKSFKTVQFISGAIIPMQRMVPTQRFPLMDEVHCQEQEAEGRRELSESPEKRERHARRQKLEDAFKAFDLFPVASATTFKDDFIKFMKDQDKGVNILVFQNRTGFEVLGGKPFWRNIEVPWMLGTCGFRVYIALQGEQFKIRLQNTASYKESCWLGAHGVFSTKTVYYCKNKCLEVTFA